MPGSLFCYRRSVCRGEHLADLLHLTADKLFGEFRVMARHIRIGVSQNLRQHVYRHSVFHGKAGERMSGDMRRQCLVDIAYCRDLLEVGVHLVVARYRQHPAPLPAGFVRFVFAEQRDRISAFLTTCSAYVLKLGSSASLKHTALAAIVCIRGPP